MAILGIRIILGLGHWDFTAEEIIIICVPGYVAAAVLELGSKPLSYTWIIHMPLHILHIHGKKASRNATCGDECKCRI